MKKMQFSNGNLSLQSNKHYKKEKKQGRDMCNYWTKAYFWQLYRVKMSSAAVERNSFCFPHCKIMAKVTEIHVLVIWDEVVVFSEVYFQITDFWTLLGYFNMKWNFVQQIIFQFIWVEEWSINFCNSLLQHR